MNKFTLLILQLSIFFIITIGFSQDKVIINYNAPEIKFNTEVMDLGTFMQYDDPSSQCEFIFTNTGKEPLIISKAKGSCGCTVPEWPKEPIMSGETGLIKVNYDEKRVGSFNKSITITSNAKNSPQIIKIKGKIIAVDKKSTEPLKKQSNLVPTAN
ncbi:MAG: hypothetical protein CMP56_00595 [Flavobacteriales bacterium]|nr:hypothetical protein [Flavobacteriales bacterium]|tara:strand:- start:1506 stop:1973 length:468 start_codon:yes stop_codon:yes gene_type:complete